MVASANNVTEVQPHFDAIYKLPVRGVSVSGVAPPESGFDFYSRFFCPKIGINEVIKRIENYDHNVPPIALYCQCFHSSKLRFIFLFRILFVALHI